MNHFLKTIDSFGQQISLNLKKEYKHKTAIGGFGTILMIIVLGLFLFSKIEHFFMKKDIEVHKQDIFETNPEEIILSDDKFMFAVMVEQEFVNFIDNPMFLVKAEYRNYERISGNKRVKNKIPLQLEPCTAEHWNKIKGIQGKDMFVTAGLQNWLCPVEGQDLRLEGIYSSNIFQFIKFSLIDCEEKQESKYWANWNYKCASKQLKDQHLKAKGDFRFKFMFSNYIVNPQSENYLQTFLNSDYQFTFVPEQLYRECDIFVASTEVITDNQIYPSTQDSIDIQELPIFTGEMREQFHLRKLKGEYGSFYIRKSKNSQKINRKFMKLQDLMSYIGGFSEIIYSAFGAIVILLNYQHQLMTLANSLYNFEDDTKKKKKKEKQPQPNIRSQQKKMSLGNRSDCLSSHHANKQRASQRELIKSSYRENQLLKTNSGIKELTLKITQKLGFKNQIHFLTYQLQDYVHKIYRLHLSTSFYIYKLTRGRLFKTTQNVLLEKGIKRAKKQIDLSEIIDKLNDIDKIKKLILDEEQLKLFNCTPKPLIKKDIITKNNSQALPESSKPMHRSHFQKLQKQSTKNFKQRMNFRQKLNLSFRTYMIVIKAKQKLLNLIHSRQGGDTGINGYINLFHSYMNISERLQKQQQQESALMKKPSFQISLNTVESPVHVKQAPIPKQCDIQKKINKELIEQMGEEMRDIFDTSKLLEIPKITRELIKRNTIDGGGSTSIFDSPYISKESVNRQDSKHDKNHFNFTTAHQNHMQSSFMKSSFQKVQNSREINLSFNAEDQSQSHIESFNKIKKSNSPKNKDFNDKISESHSSEHESVSIPELNFSYSQQDQEQTCERYYMNPSFSHISLKIPKQYRNSVDKNQKYVEDSTQWKLPDYARQPLENFTKVKRNNSVAGLIGHHKMNLSPNSSILNNNDHL